jgi:hypothetical protein
VGLLMSGIYIPGHGEMSWEEARVDRAVREYDERLFFARNEETWDWCVFVKMPRPEPAFPIVGFGNTIPSVDVVMERVRRADTMRNGDKIYNDLVKSQMDFKKQHDDKASEASAESSEVVEHFLRKHGKSPVIKEFISKSIPKGGEASDA